MKTDDVTLNNFERYLERRFKSFFCSWLSGKTVCKWLKENGSKNWRQDEWPGFFFEEIVRNKIFNGNRGEYDVDASYEKTFLQIECKTHSSSSKTDTIILNSVENTKRLLEKYGRILVIIGLYDAKIDRTGEFRKWHNAFKGGKATNYIGKYNRPLKASAKFTGITSFILNEDALDKMTILSRNMNDKYKVRMKDVIVKKHS